MRRVTAVFILGILIAQSAASANLPPGEKVDELVAREMAKNRIPGMAVVVVSEGRPVMVRGYGLSSVSLNTPVSVHTVFQLFSVSKLWAGVLIMKLVEEERLDLDSSVLDLVGGLPDHWREISLRHLLSHTSGIAEWRENPRAKELSEQEKKVLTAQQSVEMSAEVSLRSVPGAKFSYHRTGYNFVTWIVETVTGRAYPGLLSEEIFQPLGMVSTRFGDSFAVVAGRPPLNYHRDEGVLRNWLYEFGEAGYTASALNSSAADVAKFLVAIDDNSLLRPASFEQLWTPTRLNDGSEIGYGLGWTVGKHQGLKVVGHEGGGAVWLAHFPEKRLSVAVLTNLNGLRADQLQYDIADIFLE